MKAAGQCVVYFGCWGDEIKYDCRLDSDCNSTGQTGSCELSGDCHCYCRYD
ncbi:UNVERIFIED_CONTAM: hypothetical protein RMT77_017367 [Armadillidium vulgare]